VFTSARHEANVVGPHLIEGPSYLMLFTNLSLDSMTVDKSLHWKHDTQEPACPDIGVKFVT